ncbi:unnamed protein product [Dibothriocephalus latus]|uniref:Uncharacterized protein n=1 Tax=Dibothriocephalus latus TaxID=60516 RepID=A0A3P7NA51_DIBLA|nr:unnamed protein product [Dibothriocephalus latus]
MNLPRVASRTLGRLWLPATTYRFFSSRRQWQKDVTDRLASSSTDEATLVGGTGGGLGAAGPQPYLQPKPCNIRYNPRIYNGGVLPRLTFDDEPVKLPEYQPGDRWVPHRAHFGQNDYIGES